MTTAPPIEMDLFADIARMYTQALAAEGFAVDPRWSISDLSINFVNMQHRRILPKPRAVKWSAELLKKRPTLPLEEWRALFEIEAAARAGADLNSRISRQALKATHTHDRTLNDLGLHHLHLGRTLDPQSGAINGTDLILFVFVENETLYFVDVRPHNDWGAQELVDIPWANWPEMFEEDVLPFAIPHSGPNPDAETRRLARNAGLMMFPQGPDGRPYMPHGGGIQSNGLSSKVIDESDRLLNWLKAAEDTVRADPTAIAACIQKQTGGTPAALRLGLRFEGNRPVVIDENFKVVVCRWSRS